MASHPGRRWARRPSSGSSPAMTLTSQIALAKRVPAGQGVSYGHRYTTTQETTLALVPLGYADGVPRHLTNLGEVLLNGRRYRIAGTVCMDQFVLDVGDDVVAGGRRGRAVRSGLDLASRPPMTGPRRSARSTTRSSPGSAPGSHGLRGTAVSKRRKFGVAALAAGVAGAAAAGALAAERHVVGRASNQPDPFEDEPFGTLHTEGIDVIASDGVHDPRRGRR